MYKSKTGGQYQIMITKDALTSIMSVGSKNTDIAKTFNSSINLVSCYVKHHGLKDALREPEDDNSILQVLRKFHQFHKNIGHYCASSRLRAKGMKVKQVRLCPTLKNL